MIMTKIKVVGNKLKDKGDRVIKTKRTYYKKLTFKRLQDKKNLKEVLKLFDVENLIIGLIGKFNINKIKKIQIESQSNKILIFIFRYERMYFKLLSNKSIEIYFR